MSIVITCKIIIGKTICIKKRNLSSEVEENDSNDTLPCDDNAHKIVLYTPSLFLKIIIRNNFFACFRRWTMDIVVDKDAFEEILENAYAFYLP